MYTKAIFVRRRDEFERVDVAGIQYIEKQQNDCLIVTAEKTHSVSGSLTALHERLANAGFCRVHKSYLVSLDHVERVKAGQIMVKGKRIPIGDLYAKSFYGLLMRQPDVDIKPRLKPPPVRKRWKKRGLE